MNYSKELIIVAKILNSLEGFDLNSKITNRRIAIPWITDIHTKCKRQPELSHFDMEIEKMGLNVLPPKYEKALKKYYKTDDKKKIMQKAWRDDEIPVYVPKCKSVELVNKDTGDSIKKIAGRRMSNRSI